MLLRETIKLKLKLKVKRRQLVPKLTEICKATLKSEQEVYF